MLTVYRVVVQFHGNLKSANWLHVEKHIIKARVVKTGSKLLHVCSYPEIMQREGTVIKVPVEDCYSNKEDALKEADRRAALLVAKLKNYIAELEEPAEVNEGFA